jgi:signal transduction histidine kinase
MRRARAWLLIAGGWATLALFFAVSNSLTYKSTGRPPNWILSIERSAADWMLWALFTPVAVWLARRFSLHGRRILPHVFVHLAAGLAFAVAATIGSRLLFAALAGMWMYFLVSTLAFNFAVYCGVVAAAHGMEYYRRSREREQLEARLTETRLQLLGMQLQPHFLFNTLNTIAEMVHEDVDKADAMIGSLSDLLRRTLDLGARQEITLDEELDLVSRYLDIQKARFGDRLRVQTTIDPSVHGVRVPALLLQPLVENAIRHGLSARVDAGRIDIDARQSDGMLLVTVVDDGPSTPLGGSGPAGNGQERVGLGNTRARLEALYGGDAGLVLGRSEGRGTQVTIRIPLRLEAPA